MDTPISLRNHMEAFIHEWFHNHQPAARRADLDAFRTAMLDDLQAHGLQIEDFTESEYMSFELSQSGSRWTLVVNEFDERTGPYKRTLEFDSRQEARRAVLKVVLPTMRNYGALHP